MGTINNETIVVVTGMGGTGKSTFCTFCKQYLTKEYSKLDFWVEELSTVDFVYEVAKYCGWEGTKTDKDRIFLSDLKVALTKWQDIPLNNLFSNITATGEFLKGPGLYFVNSREPKDINRIKLFARDKGYNFLIVKVYNSNTINNEVPELVDGIKSIKPNYIINNNGSLDDLRAEVKLFCDTQILPQVKI